MYKYILRIIYTNIYLNILVYTQKPAVSDVITASHLTIKKIQEHNFLTQFTGDTEISTARKVH